MSTPVEQATVRDCLRLGAGFSARDRDWIVEQFATLDARLAGFPADGTDLELMVKDRDAKGQKVTLECHVPNFPRFVTTSGEEDLRAALNDCRDDLRRQLNDAKTQRQPRHNRHLRETDLPAPQPEQQATV